MSVNAGTLDRLPGPLLLFTGLLLLPAVMTLSSTAGEFGVLTGFTVLYGLISVALGTAAIRRT